MHFNKTWLVWLHSVLRGNQGPSCLAIYLAVPGNQSHREGKEMIQPRQAQERVRREGGGGGLGREYVQRTTALLGSINQESLHPIIWGKQSRCRDRACRSRCNHLPWWRDTVQLQLCANWQLRFRTWARVHYVAAITETRSAEFLDLLNFIVSNIKEE